MAHVCSCLRGGGWFMCVRVSERVGDPFVFVFDRGLVAHVFSCLR